MSSPVVADAPPMMQRTGAIPELAELRRTSAKRLEDLLGTPTLRRQDGTAEMWQYASPDCTLLLFLYPGKDGAYAVTYLEAEPGGTSDHALKSCITAAARRPIPAT